MASNAMMGAAYGLQGITSLVSGFAQASALRAQGEYQSMMLRFNADLASLQAKDALKRGDKAADDYRTQVSQLLGTQRVSYAGQGVALGEGSAAEVQEDTAVRGAQDVVTIRTNAWKEAWGYRVQAQDLKTQAKFAKIGSQFSASQSILTGVSNAASGFLMAGAYGQKAYEDKFGSNKTPSQPDPYSPKTNSSNFYQPLWLDIKK